MKSHAWFLNVDWDAYMLRRIRAPWVPSISGPIDYSHYDPYGINDHIDDGQVDDSAKWDNDF